MATERNKTKRAAIEAGLLFDGERFQKGGVHHSARWLTPGSLRESNGVLGVGHLSGGNVKLPGSGRKLFDQLLGLTAADGESVTEFAKQYGPLVPYRGLKNAPASFAYRGLVPERVAPNGPVLPYGTVGGPKFDHRTRAELLGSPDVFWNESVEEWRAFSHLANQCVRLYAAARERDQGRREELISEEFADTDGIDLVRMTVDVPIEAGPLLLAAAYAESEPTEGMRREDRWTINAKGTIVPWALPESGEKIMYLTSADSTQALTFLYLSSVVRRWKAIGYDGRPGFELSGYFENGLWQMGFVSRSLVAETGAALEFFFTQINKFVAICFHPDCRTVIVRDSASNVSQRAWCDACKANGRAESYQKAAERLHTDGGAE